MDNSQDIFLASGTVLSGKYQIIRLIGSGGMGTVYMAYDNSLDMKVAVKVISPHILEDQDQEHYEAALRRFHTEARIAAQIDHPNVVRILGFDTDNITYNEKTVEIDYLVMELLAERNLRHTMDESGFETEAEIKDWISKYMIPILEGVEKVHSKGIIHRDIKPENFFLKGDRVKLADFGLSMGIDQPSVTGPMVDIFGTLKYMSPEQFYNFSLAREPSDIYSLGKILYEAVDGTITDKVKPFKQARISRTDNQFFQALAEIIADATAGNPKERISSARELMVRLSGLLHCSLEARKDRQRKSPRELSASLIPFLGLIILIAALIIFLYRHERFIDVAKTINSAAPAGETVQIISTPVLDDLEDHFRSRDNSIMQLVPGIQVAGDTGQPFSDYTTAPFYLSENPVTNQQFVSFLNDVKDRLTIEESDLLLDGKLILKLSEKIREYKPIVFTGEKFVVQEPMHSACAVLMVTGHGAVSYADHYGLRLLQAREWYAVMSAQNRKDHEKLPLPTPVINYAKNRFDIRGINQLAEWGQSPKGEYMVLGKASSSMIESELISDKDPYKYYTDTSFRVAVDITNLSSS